jgi:predicted SPOUT superfamily RNA methylase MTH1
MLTRLVNMQEGYDLKIGTSERGAAQPACELQLPPHRHALLAFGGPTGLEDCLSRDPDRATDDVSTLFSHWLNTCPGQGSRTIRTEEALLISLAYFQPALQKACART